jgi:hypothetical protein
MMMKKENMSEMTMMMNKNKEREIDFLSLLNQPSQKHQKKKEKKRKERKRRKERNFLHN